jgi:hypothetical protein
LLGAGNEGEENSKAIEKSAEAGVNKTAFAFEIPVGPAGGVEV